MRTKVLDGFVRIYHQQARHLASLREKLPATCSFMSLIAAIVPLFNEPSYLTQKKTETVS